MLSGTSMEEHGGVLWLFLQVNAVSPALFVASWYILASSALQCDLKTASE